MLLQLKNGGCFLYDSGYLKLFGRTDSGSKNRLLFGILGVLVILIGSGTYGIEYDGGMNRLIRVNSFGTFRLYLRKAGVSEAVLLLLFTGYYGTYFYRVFRTYGARGLSFPLNSVSGMELSGIGIGTGLILLWCLRFLMLSLLLHMTFLLSKKVKSRHAVILGELFFFSGLLFLM